MSQQDIAICWFRQDLRLADNPAFAAACAHDQVLCLYILEDDDAKSAAMGEASRWWVHHSLQNLQHSLDGKLTLISGSAKTILLELIQDYPIKAVYWNRCYEPWRIKRDEQIKKQLIAAGCTCQSFNGSLLWEPWECLKKDGTPYQVFTPFYNNGCLSKPPPRAPLDKPTGFTLYPRLKNGADLSSLALLPTIAWDEGFYDKWHAGEDAAQIRLAEFLEHGINDYKEGRDFPARESVSRLSPHLHFGEISPHQIWYAAKRIPATHNRAHFLRELGWREFSYSLLYHFPKLPRQNLNSRFDKFPWSKGTSDLRAWQQGQTGIPFVDAGMRELWQTGYMHNRVRMVVGSFLVKNLLLHWHHGEKWFWDCLLDADLANNSASWQWVAGCGADAAPYFRVFNPVTQGKKFDTDGSYTKRFVPELANLPDKYLFAPWEAPENVLQASGVILGKTYPHPIVCLKASRERALTAYQAIK